MYQFDFAKPKTLDDLKALREGEAEVQYLAGGMTLIATLKQRLAMPELLVDISAIDDLKGLSKTADGLKIGALTKHADVASNADVKNTIPTLAKLAGMIGDPQVRNRGTLGGSVANNDPSADYPAAVLALKGTIHTENRSITADDFFVDLFETALDEGELLTAIEVKTPTRASYQKFANPASRYAIAGVFVADLGGGDVRVAVTGAGPCVYRLKDFEAALAKDFSVDAIKGLEVSADGLNEDVHASPDYRADLVKTLTMRAVKELTD